MAGVGIRAARCAAIAALFISSVAQGQVAIDSVSLGYFSDPSSPFFDTRQQIVFVDVRTQGGGRHLRGAYLGYRITNTGATRIQDAWARLGDFLECDLPAAPTATCTPETTSDAHLELATNEDGWYHLGALDPGAAAVAYFYVQLTSNSSEEYAAPRLDSTANVRVFDGFPGSISNGSPCSIPSGPSQIGCATQTLVVSDSLLALSNEIFITTTTPDTAGNAFLGGVLYLDVEGCTGTPARPVGWPGRPPARVFQLSRRFPATVATTAASPSGPVLRMKPTSMPTGSGSRTSKLGSSRAACSRTVAAPTIVPLDRIVCRIPASSS